MDRVVIWYGLCAVVGAASAWIGGIWLSVAVICALIGFGLILANIPEKLQDLPLHHAITGLAVTLAFGRILPMAVFALGSGP